MIGLSLLPSPHPKAFQRLPVRPSGRCYPPFSLDKGRSPGFASAVADFAPSSGSLSLRLRASLRLASPATATRGLIMQKARRHRIARLRPLAGAWFQGLFHSSARGSFHLSLTVLVHCRSPGSIQPCGMVPADSRRIPRVLRYSGGGPAARVRFAYGAFTLYGRRFHAVRLRTGRLSTAAPTTPAGASPRPRFGLLRFRSPLLAESFVYFLFLRVLRCFSSPRWPWLCQCPCGRVSPFGHPRISSYLPIPAAFRSLSRPSSPPGALGIPHAPSFAFLFLFLRAAAVHRGRALALGFAFTLACTPCQ